MTRSVARQVADLGKLDLGQLRGRWRELFCSEPPGYSRVFMARRLAYRLQELALGGQSEEARAVLGSGLSGERLDEDGRAKKKSRRSKPTAGTRLVREWDGERHEVTVVARGFEYRGRLYKSLSAIARLVTGTRWNGPLFFGLRTGEK